MRSRAVASRAEKFNLGRPRVGGHETGLLGAGGREITSACARQEQYRNWKLQQHSREGAKERKRQTRETLCDVSKPLCSGLSPLASRPPLWLACNIYILVAASERVEPARLFPREPGQQTRRPLAFVTTTQDDAQDQLFAHRPRESKQQNSTTAATTRKKGLQLSSGERPPNWRVKN